MTSAILNTQVQPCPTFSESKKCVWAPPLKVLCCSVLNAVTRLKYATNVQFLPGTATTEYNILPPSLYVWTIRAVHLGILPGYSTYHKMLASFQALLGFHSSVCIQYNTRKWKSGKKRGRPGNTYQVNDVWWTWSGRRGGGGLSVNCEVSPSIEHEVDRCSFMW